MPGRTQVDKLTPKQELFVQFVAMGKGHTEAAEAAGYTGASLPQTAYHLANKPHVAHAIARAREQQEITFTWTIESWRNELGRCLGRARTAEDLPSQLRALELAGKHLGALEPTAPISPAAAELIALIGSAMQQQRQLPATVTVIDDGNSATVTRLDGRDS